MSFPINSIKNDVPLEVWDELSKHINGTEKVVVFDSKNLGGLEQKVNQMASRIESLEAEVFDLKEGKKETDREIIDLTKKNKDLEDNVTRLEERDAVKERRIQKLKSETKSEKKFVRICLCAGGGAIIILGVTVICLIPGGSTAFLEAVPKIAKAISDIKSNPIVNDVVKEVATAGAV